MQKKYSPLKQFNLYWNLARRKKDLVADNLYLATIDSKNNPHVRTVLIKTVDKNGIGFVTQSLGPKIAQLKKTAIVECCVAWPKLHLQVRLRGGVKPMPKKLLKHFWNNRPRDAKLLYSLGLPQSSPIPSYEYLLHQVSALAVKWRRKKKIPLSPYYTGFVIDPKTIEFLHHNPSRLNKREFFEKTSKGWTRTCLAP